MRCSLFVLFLATLLGSCVSFRAPSGLSSASGVFRSIYSLPTHPPSSLLASLRTNEHRYYVPPKYLLNTLKKTSDQRVTVADVSSLSGVELPSAQRDLMELAHATGAALQVSKQGDIMYAFPQDLERILLKRSYARRVQRLYEKLAPTLMFLFRASFGLCLAASLAVITVALTAATTAASTSPKNTQKDKEKEKDKKGHRRVEYGRPRVVVVLDLADIVRTAMRLARPHSQHGKHMQSSHELNFLDSFYSFVFGDGDPNAGELLFFLSFILLHPTFAVVSTPHLYFFVFYSRITLVYAPN